MEKLQSKKPLVRFPEFVDAWEHKKLSELLSVSKQLNGDLRYSKDEVLSVSGECGIVNQIEHMGRSYAGESVHNYHVVETGDIVYTKSPLKANPFGIIKLNKGNAGIVSTLYAVYHVNKKNAVGEFLDYYFSLDANTNRYLRPLVKKGAKNDMKINNAYVLHDRIFAPTTQEQKRISSFFTVLETKIFQLKQKKTLLEQYKKGVMQKIFAQEIRFRDIDGSEFPEWEQKKLGKISSWASGGTPSKDNPLYWNGSIPWITASSMHGVKYFDSEYKITNEGLNNGSKLAYKGNLLILVRGSMLFNKIPIGLVSRDVAFNQDVKSIEIDSKNDTKYILYWFISSENVILSMVSGTGIGAGKLDLSDLKKISLPLPCLKEQTKIAEFLSSIDEKINHCSTQIEKTEQYKKGLIQQMFC